ncbi:MAG: bifunctional 3-hydroxydecanoyl-ACP dehydratase/trans-2-decenoyl-ACP isomerase [Proteobacteria bacterium]|nr:bifunctional 3-hydroxydecanoyl-ACP dehydratase/trans-2-decenoyl-ACP isomerase [Pseudomonadota bacterium]
MSFVPKSSYSKNELIDCSNGKLFTKPGDGRLPSDNMLMFDEIVDINDSGGEFNKGSVVANLIMPGCLGLDAMWQLLGFYLLWSGLPGIGRALGAEKVKFFGQVLPNAKLVRYELDIKRVINRGAVLGLANGKMFVDDRQIYSAEKLKVGLFDDPSNF